MVLDILAVDNFDFTRKIVKKDLGEKLVKMLGVLSKLNFWTKFDFSNSVTMRRSKHFNVQHANIRPNNKHQTHERKALKKIR